MYEGENSFITAAKAIELINAHTEENPIVDLRFLVVNNQYIEAGHNFTIKLVSKDKNGKTVPAGVLYARIMNLADQYSLREAIKEAYKRVADIELNLDERPTREVTSVVDPDTNAKGVPMLDNSKDPMYTPNRNTKVA